MYSDVFIAILLLKFQKQHRQLSAYFLKLFSPLFMIDRKSRYENKIATFHFIYALNCIAISDIFCSVAVEGEGLHKF